jgi:hypothetical protein
VPDLLGRRVADGEADRLLRLTSACFSSTRIRQPDVMLNNPIAPRRWPPTPARR